MHATATIEDRVADLSMFAGTPRKQLRHLMRLMTPATVKPGRILTVEGDPGDQCMIIVAGQARVVRDGTVVATLGAGDIVGEIAVLRGGRRTATVVAVCETTLEVLTPREFRSALEEHAGLAQTVEACLAERVSGR